MAGNPSFEVENELLNGNVCVDDYILVCRRKKVENEQYSVLQV